LKTALNETYKARWWFFFDYQVSTYVQFALNAVVYDQETALTNSVSE